MKDCADLEFVPLDDGRCMVIITRENGRIDTQELTPAEWVRIQAASTGPKAGE